jgi:predicted Zn-dependent protease
MPTIAEWQGLLDEEPDNELIRFSLARQLLEEKRFAEAVPHFERLVKDQPDYALAWAFLARARLQAGDREGARAACEQGLPHALAQRHETPEDEIRAVLDELDSEF